MVHQLINISLNYFFRFLFYYVTMLKNDCFEVCLRLFRIRKLRCIPPTPPRTVRTSTCSCSSPKRNSSRRYFLHLFNIDFEFKITNLKWSKSFFVMLGAIRHLIGCWVFWQRPFLEEGQWVGSRDLAHVRCLSWGHRCALNTGAFFICFNPDERFCFACSGP